MTGFSDGSEAEPSVKAWQRSLQRFFQLPTVEITIAVLVVVSVVFTIIELSLPESSPLLLILDDLNQIITWLFVVELTLRFLATPIKRLFFQEYWLDILAVLPLLRVFRVVRVLRLLRLLRLFGLFNRHASTFQHILRRGAPEYIIICGLIILTVCFGTFSLVALERGSYPQWRNLEQAFWSSFYMLFSGQPLPGAPRTLAGNLVVTFILFMNATIFAMFTGTVSAFMVDKLRMEGQVTDWEQFSNHMIVCGWNKTAEIIVRQYKAADKNEDTPVVVIAQLDEEPNFNDAKLKEQVRFIKDDFTKVSVLEKAGIRRAKTCIILADKSHGRSEQDADARTILAALTVERINPAVYTCAELINREYGAHLEMGQVNDYVVSEEQNGFMLAQSALNPGLMSVFNELLTGEQGNQFYRLPIGDAWVGKTFLELFAYLKQTHNAILIAVSEPTGVFQINPNDYRFKYKDYVIVIAEQKIRL
ncbi:MAG TPA: ion transporter [Coleofasciculaceae cyanobacterium]|jgi:voltage-gated potassium channel